MRLLWVLSAAALLIPEASFAQAGGSGRDSIPALDAVRRRSPVEIDGRLREAGWDRAPAAAHFVQRAPREGAEPAWPTEVRVLYDDEAMYVGARLFDDPSAVRDQLVRRDGQGAFDFFRFEVDPFESNRTGYLFQVSAAGVQRDAYLFDDTNVDDHFDAVWSSSVHRGTRGWSIEMRIPLSQIDFDATDGVQVWGVNFVRRRLASSSVSMFALRSRTESGRVSQYGKLRGLQFRGGGRALELTPYGAAQARRAPASAANPFFDGFALSPRAGLHARWSFASNFTLDATVNPGFGQVEADPAVVNLTAFETFFPEKRPFFTKEARLFDFRLSGPNRILFHSRRIGRAPRGNPPDGADFTDVPRVTSILGAAKVTGRIAGGTSLGILGAVTAEETGRAFFRKDGSTRAFVAQPRSEYGVARIQQNLRGGATNMGAIVAGVHRQRPESGVFDHLPATAGAGGIDFEHQWGGTRNRRYALWGYVSGSYVRGTPNAMTNVQTNANHYFQRPDAGYKRVDSTATHLTGREWRIQIERRSAEHWTWQAWVNEVSPGYVIDDIGFAGSTLPRIDVGGQLRYQDITPGLLFRSWSVRLNTFHNFRHSFMERPFAPSQWSGAHQGGRFLLSGSFAFHNNWNLRLASTWAPEHSTERETRGGPLMMEPGAYALDARLQTDPRASLSALAAVGRRDWIGGGVLLRARTQLQWHPAPNWEIRVGPTYERHRDEAQYVASTPVLSYAPTFGKRYLFADVTRDELALQARLDAAFTPNLSLQLFAQPLVASGNFTAYKQLTRPASFDFRRFREGRLIEAPGGKVGCEGGTTCAAEGTRHVDFNGDERADISFSDRDFTLGSLRGTAVLRWEYVPGSALYLAWQQNRQRRREIGRFNASRSLGALFGSEGTDRFILKLRHRLAF